MRHPTVKSGARYPVLRALAILYLVGAVVTLILGVWQAVAVLIGSSAMAATAAGGETLIGAPSGGTLGRIYIAASWLGATFIAVLFMVGIAELIKLFMDIEHNTRTITGGGSATAEGEETAEGALLRGH